MNRLISKCCFILIVSVLIGCGGEKHTVTGTVCFEDGTPLTEGTVTMEQDNVSCTGFIDASGKFSMGMIRQGEGIPLGLYRVAVMASTGPGKYLVDEKFVRPSTSGITFEVKQGSNAFNITVTPPQTK